jgi:peptide deformylase
MSILPILKHPNNTLRQKAEQVKEITDEIKQLISDMIKIMVQGDGAGLAANQVGNLNRVIITTNNKNEIIPLINPEIIKKSFSKTISDEGCLSIPDTNGNVKRFKKIKVMALDQDGNKIEFWANKLHSIIIQHEIDHLDGVLFIDKLGK